MPRQTSSRRPASRAAVSKERPDREGKRLITAHVEPEVYRDFKVLAAQKGVTTDLMLTKALALLFDDLGERPPPALRRKLEDHKL